MPLDLAKDKPMGKGKPEPVGPSEDLGAFDAALDDAFDAVKNGDKAAFRAAMGAAVSAKCAEMYDDTDEEL